MCSAPALPSSVFPLRKFRVPSTRTTTLQVKGMRLAYGHCRLNWPIVGRIVQAARHARRSQSPQLRTGGRNEMSTSTIKSVNAAPRASLLAISPPDDSYAFAVSALVEWRRLSAARRAHVAAAAVLTTCVQFGLLALLWVSVTTNSYQGRPTVSTTYRQAVAAGRPAATPGVLAAAPRTPQAGRPAMECDKRLPLCLARGCVVHLLARQAPRANLGRNSELLSTEARPDRLRANLRAICARPLVPRLGVAAKWPVCACSHGASGWRVAHVGRPTCP
jgi:hypothetical protein